MLRVGAAACALTLMIVMPSAVAAAPVVVTVVTDDVVGPTNPRLRGVGWNTGSLAGVEPLAPPTVRIDGSLQAASTGPDALDLTDLLARVAQVREVGAEPQVILSYMPVWLADVEPGDPRDPTRVAPSDFDAWQALIEEVVETLATAPAPARRFEVWNEPDLPVFWQDLPTEFLELARRSHAGVAAVEKRTGLDLEIGGPATAFPDPVFIVPYAETLRSEDLPLDYVSWHFYGNHPFLGPDGNEGFVPDAVYQAGAHRNPFTTPREFGEQIGLVRSWVGDEVELVIDEWNVAAGGFDTRHDTHEGAAFDAAVLIEMERAGLDAADFYRAADNPDNDGRVGDWGLVDADGVPKPSWWVFDAWRRTSGDRIGVTGDDPDNGLWVRATASGAGVDVVLAAFTARGGNDLEVEVRIDDAALSCVTARVIDGPEGTFHPSTGETEAVEDGSVTVDASDPSVVWLRFRPACAEAGSKDERSGGGDGRGGEPSDPRVSRAASPEQPRGGDGDVLPATGGGGSLALALGAVATAVGLGWLRGRVTAL